MTHKIRFTRSLALIRLRRRLERDSFPRMQMGLIIFISGMFGFLSSYLLLQMGVQSMALRYPLALSFAYIFFLFLLWMWLRYKTEDYADLADFADFIPTSSDSESASTFLNIPDGRFSGGGASSSFSNDDVNASAVDMNDSFMLSGDKSSFSLDFDEFAIPIIIFALALGLTFAALYIVYLAPALFAELILDGILSYTLYRRLKKVNTEHWLMTAFRRTILPFALTATFLFIIGLSLSIYAPGAYSIADVIYRRY